MGKMAQANGARWYEYVLKREDGRRLKGHPLQVRHKQDWGQGFILLLPQDAVLPECWQ